jgi:pilus assembly protein CpaC
MNFDHSLMKRLPRGRVALGALLIALACPMARLAAQASTPMVQHDRHADLFTKPAVAAKAAAPQALPVAMAASKAPAAPSNGPAIVITKPEPAASSGLAAAGDFYAAAPVEQKLHLVVGRSTFVNTRHRLTRVYVTAPSILDTYTASPNQVVVTAKKPGTSSLIVWDEAGESQAFLVTSDLNLEVLSDALKQANPNEAVKVTGNENRIVLTGTTGTEKVSKAAGDMALAYSKDVTNAIVVNPSTIKQVNLKVRIVEVDRTKLNAFAINLFNQGGSNYAGSTTGQASSSLSVTPQSATAPASISFSNPLNFFLYSSKYNFGVTLQDLETLGCLQILSEPNLTTMSGEKGSFLAGGEFPFPVVQGGAGGQTSISISFRPYGVKLEFTPVVNTDGTIELHVVPEVSSLDYSNSVQISGYTIPALSTRKAETQVVLRSGETFAISGLLDKRTTDQFENTPGISSVPILGQLFKSKNVNHSAQELVVIVTPTIVDPLTDTTFPVEPKLPVPLMDTTKFDKILPELKGKKH